MRLWTALLLVVLLASGAWAGLDPDPDQMGIYFDSTGETVCVNASFASEIPVYILYTNPTVPAVRGFECSLVFTGQSPVNSIALDAVFPTLATDIGAKSSGNSNYLVGFSSPVPTSPATILAQVSLFYLDAFPIDLILGPAVPASLGSEFPVILRVDYSLLPVGMSAPVGPSASINAVDCSVVATDEATWGSIKAMYR